MNTTSLNEYCDHCAKKHNTANSFIGLAKPGTYAQVLCKGCGITEVDQYGSCLKCAKKSYESHKIVAYVSLTIAFVALMLYICI